MMHLLPTAGGGTAIDMQDLAGDERGVLQIHHGIDDLLRLAQTTHRLQVSEKCMRFRRMRSPPSRR